MPVEIGNQQVLEGPRLVREFRLDRRRKFRDRPLFRCPPLLVLRTRTGVIRAPRWINRGCHTARMCVDVVAPRRRDLAGAGQRTYDLMPPSHR